MSAKAERAAQLCKADLLTDVVGEFPELQGLMGRYYAEAQGEDEAVAHACEDHYKPKGPDDLVPADPVSIAVALADKIDTLVGFWAIDEKPTGSKDPLCAAARGARRHPHRDRERVAAAAARCSSGIISARSPATRWRRRPSRCCTPLHEQIVKLSAADVELAVKLEVLMAEKARQHGRSACWCRRMPISTRPATCSPSSPTA